MSFLIGDPSPGERRLDDWLKSYLKYTEATEAPPHMHFWAGVSAIAGALRRQVWVDQAYFKWYPNFYIVLVAPPGIVSKSTTTGIAMKLLRQVPGIKFGPDVVTWQSLVEKFAESTEEVELDPINAPGHFSPMSAMTLESSEFGNLLDPKDTGMIDLLVSLWDGKEGTFEKTTKKNGTDVIANPWINIIACTTPAWIHGNFPEYMIGGGFTSRTIFVYADKKAKFIPYPFLNVQPEEMKRAEDDLVYDLIEISRMKGAFKLTSKAVEWGSEWYRKHYTNRPLNLDMEAFGGYFARKQVMMHKLAMVLSAAEGSSMVITDEHLATADYMITDLEPDLQFVFKRVGQKEVSAHVEKFVSFVQAHPSGVEYSAAYRHVHGLFPSIKDFEDIVLGCIRSGYIKASGDGRTLYPGPHAMATSIQRGEDGKRKGGEPAMHL